MIDTERQASYLFDVPTRTVRKRLWGQTVTGHDRKNKTAVSFVIGDIRRKNGGGYFVYDTDGDNVLTISDAQLFAIYDGKDIHYNGLEYSVTLGDTYPVPSKQRISRLRGKPISKRIVDGEVILSVDGVETISSIVEKEPQRYVVYADDDKFPFAVLSPRRLAELVDVHRTNLGKSADVRLNCK